MRKLSEVKNQIIRDHNRKAKISSEYLEDKAFKLFVQRLSGMEAERVIDYVKLISDENLQGLVQYVVLNKYDVKLDNLFKVLDLKASKEQLVDVFIDWEKNYMRANDTRPYVASLVMNNIELRSGLYEKNIDLNQIRWIESEHCVEDICKENKCFHYKDFSEKLSICGVIKETALCESCLTEFIISCDDDTYRELTDVGVAKLFMQLKTPEQRVKFCVNYTKKLDVNYLLSSKEVSNRVHNLYCDTSQNKYLLNVIEENGLLDKFLTWMKRHEVRDIFTVDEDDKDLRRSKFWPQYINHDTFYETNKFALCIHFDNYVVIEFMGKAAGPAFLMTKKYYDNPDNRVKNRFHYGTKDGQDGLRTILKDQWRNKENGRVGYDGLIQRMPHQDGQYKQHPWEGLFRGWLADVGIR